MPTPELVESITRAVCKASGLCKYYRERCNTGRCSVSPDVGVAALKAHDAYLAEQGASGREPIVRLPDGQLQCMKCENISAAPQDSEKGE